MKQLQETMNAAAALVNEALAKALETPEAVLDRVYDAMRYSALAGGKRIRPFLVLAFCKLFGGDERAAVPFMCAIECVHASSLIHDDMPCMDNDDLRRGKPTNHKVYGEDIALLAGDALMTKGYELAAGNNAVSPAAALAATKDLLSSAGAVGMMGGQEIDLLSENKTIDFETLLTMHRKKTGALIAVSARLGCYAAGITDKNDPRMQAATRYAEGIGLAFQVIDDILDVTGDVEILGKATHADGAIGKTTFMSFMTVEEAEVYAKACTDEAVSALADFAGHEPLAKLATYLLERKH